MPHRYLAPSATKQTTAIPTMLCRLLRCMLPIALCVPPRSAVEVEPPAGFRMKMPHPKASPPDAVQPKEESRSTGGSIIKTILVVSTLLSSPMCHNLWRISFHLLVVSSSRVPSNVPIFVLGESAIFGHVIVLGFLLTSTGVGQQSTERGK